MSPTSMRTGAFGALLLFTACRVEAQSPPDSAMTLNRIGRWHEAAAVARNQLATTRLSAKDRCTVALSLAYAETRLTRRDSAEVAITDARRECGAMAHDSTYASQLAQLTAELDRGTTRAVSAAPYSRAVQGEDHFWTTIPVEASGLDAAALANHQALCERTGADACLVIRHDAIVQEWYSPRYALPMMAMSSTKSVTGILTAMLIADGNIQSLDDGACEYLSDWCSGMRGMVTLREILNMTSGLPMLRDSSVGFVSDKDAFVRHLTPTNTPGTVWAYSNEGAQLMSPILDRAAGEPIQDYARRRLFEPLGMVNTSLHVDQVGHAWTYADMYTTARDFARIGVLMLHRGVWRGQSIVPSAWVDSLVSPQPLSSHYGLLWWIDPDAKAFAAHGHLDTDIHVVRDADLVIVRMQSKPYADAKEGDYEQELLRLIPTMVRQR